MNELCCNRAEFEIMLPVEMNDNYVHNVADNDVGWLRFCCFVAASVNLPLVAGILAVLTNGNGQLAKTIATTKTPLYSIICLVSSCFFSNLLRLCMFALYFFIQFSSILF